MMLKVANAQEKGFAVMNPADGKGIEKFVRIEGFEKIILPVVFGKKAKKGTIQLDGDALENLGGLEAGDEVAVRSGEAGDCVKVVFEVVSETDAPSLENMAEGISTFLDGKVVQANTILTTPDGIKLRVKECAPASAAVFCDASEIEILAGPGAVTSDIILAIDRSWSMGHKDYKPSRYGAGAVAAKFFMDKKATLGAVDQIAIMTFGRDVKVVRDLSPFSRGELEEIFKKIDGQRTSGMTSISSAIEKGMALLHEKGKQENVKAMILLTDGGVFNENPIETAKKAKEAGVIIYPILIGQKGYYDENVLKMIAEATGGTMFYKPDEERLKELYGDLATRLVIAPAAKASKEEPKEVIEEKPVEKKEAAPEVKQAKKKKTKTKKKAPGLFAYKGYRLYAIKGKGGAELHFFSKAKPARGKRCPKPKGYEVGLTARGLPYVRKKKKGE